jgi:hypothetical protein
VFAKLNEELDSHACATGAPSCNGLGWEDHRGGIFGQEYPYPGTPGVWIRHTNPALPGACWYPGPKSFVLTGNTLSTMDLAAQGVVHTPATPNMPYVRHPTPNRPDGPPSIDLCTTNPSLCNPKPHPLPPDPTIDECFWTGYCSDFWSAADRDRPHERLGDG